MSLYHTICPRLRLASVSFCIKFPALEEAARCVSVPNHLSLEEAAHCISKLNYLPSGEVAHYVSVLNYLPSEKATHCITAHNCQLSEKAAQYQKFLSVEDAAHSVFKLSHLFLEEVVISSTTSLRKRSYLLPC